MLTDATKTKLGLTIGLVASALGVLLIVAELMNGPQPDAGLAFAERAFIFLFGAVHLAFAGILTVYRRTAT